MKSVIKGAAVLGSLMLSPFVEAKDKPVIIYLVDEQEAATTKKDLEPVDLTVNPEGDEVSDDPAGEPTDNPTDQADAEKAAERLKIAKKKLDDLIKEHQKEDTRLTEKRSRIAKQVELEQKEFIALLGDFVAAPFNPADDDIEPEFVSIRQRIVDLIFNAPTKRDYYERLFLVNTSWSAHPNELVRFQSLDNALQDRSLELEARHRKIRTIIMGVTTVVGLGLGGYFSYRASSKIIPIVANEGGFSSVAKVIGRGTIILVGAGVGAAAGAYVGFLGSDALFQNEREFIDPIDGNEDLREILDYIDGLNTKYPI